MYNRIESQKLANRMCNRKKNIEQILLIKFFCSELFCVKK